MVNRIGFRKTVGEGIGESCFGIAANAGYFTDLLKGMSIGRSLNAGSFAKAAAAKSPPEYQLPVLLIARKILQKGMGLGHHGEPKNQK